MPQRVFIEEPLTPAPLLQERHSLKRTQSSIQLSKPNIQESCCVPPNHMQTYPVILPPIFTLRLVCIPTMPSQLQILIFAHEPIASAS